AEEHRRLQQARLEVDGALQQVARFLVASLEVGGVAGAVENGRVARTVDQRAAKHTRRGVGVASLQRGEARFQGRIGRLGARAGGDEREKGDGRQTNQRHDWVVRKRYACAESPPLHESASRTALFWNRDLRSASSS